MYNPNKGIYYFIYLNCNKKPKTYLILRRHKVENNPYSFNKSESKSTFEVRLICLT